MTSTTPFALSPLLILPQKATESRRRNLRLSRNRPTRRSIRLKSAETSQADECNKPSDDDAEKSFIQGRFDQAFADYEQLLQHQPGRLDVQARLGYLDLLANRTSSAIARLTAVMEGGLRTRTVLSHLAEAYNRNGDLGHAALCYEQLGREGLAGTLAAISQLPVLQLNAGPAVCRLDWVRAEPLPVVTVAVNGKPANLIVDTGAGDTVLDVAFAVNAGIRLGGREWRDFAGGQPAEVLHGHAEQLWLNEIGITDVPVQVLDLQPTFGDWFPGMKVDGILGIRLLSLFDCTLDYIERRLELSRPTTESAPEQQGTPIWMAENWMLFSHADFPDQRQATVFLDSGMTGASFAVPESRVAALGVTPDPTATAIGTGGGGVVGGSAAEVSKLRLDALERTRCSGLILDRLSIEKTLGFRVNGLIGHDALRDTRLALDFGRMRMTLSQ